MKIGDARRNRLRERLSRHATFLSCRVDVGQLDRIELCQFAKFVEMHPSLTEANGSPDRSMTLSSRAGDARGWREGVRGRARRRIPREDGIPHRAPPLRGSADSE